MQDIIPGVDYLIAKGTLSLSLLDATLLYSLF